MKHRDYLKHTHRRGAEMQRFYFDIDNGDGLAIDEEGQIFDSCESLRQEALRVLPDIVRDEVFNNNDLRVALSVRNEEGRRVFRSELTIKSVWDLD